MANFYAEDELSSLLSIWQGRKIIFEILTRCGVFSSPFATDRAMLEYNCGAHAIGVELYNDCMSTSPKLTAMMLEEQGNYDNYRSAEQQRDNDKRDADELSLDFTRTNGLGD
jgi:hypothetical protein